MPSKSILDKSLTTAPEKIIAQTKEWLEKAVIGLNLCPFAKAVHVKNQIRYVVTETTSPEQLISTLKTELQSLMAADPKVVDTTLIIHPKCLTDFYEYNEFLAQADTAVAEMKFHGILQIASFHPNYHFAGCEPDAIENYTNRSPYPMLHILREASVTWAVESMPEAVLIPTKNVETMKKLGHEGWKKLGI
jgi:hypothetical protein